MTPLYHAQNYLSQDNNNSVVVMVTLRMTYLSGNLQRISLSLELHHDGRVHGYLQSSGSQDPGSLVLCHVRGCDPFVRLHLKGGD